MNDKHTPGPYTIVRGRNKHKEAAFIKAGPDFIGKVYGHDGQPVEANAALFAASYDMLLVLETFMRAYIARPDEYYKKDYLQAIAAMAKAGYTL